MIKSPSHKHIYWYPPGATIYMLGKGDTLSPGGWYFEDETQNIGGGPYFTEREAAEALDEYARNL